MAQNGQSGSPTQNQNNDSSYQGTPLTVLNQYIKDFSFENPNPEKSFQETSESPEMSLNLDIQANTIQDNIYEITLHLKAEAKRPDYTLFIAELQYTGIFQLNNVPQESVHPLLMIECPRLLFPFARHLMATLTREGGFPTLSLEPVDFVELYRQQYLKAQPGQSTEAKLGS